MIVPLLSRERATSTTHVKNNKSHTFPQISYIDIRTIVPLDSKPSSNCYKSRKRDKESDPRKEMLFTTIGDGGAVDNNELFRLGSWTTQGFPSKSSSNLSQIFKLVRHLYSLDDDTHRSLIGEIIL